MAEQLKLKQANVISNYLQRRLLPGFDCVNKEALLLLDAMPLQLVNNSAPLCLVRSQLLILFSIFNAFGRFVLLPIGFLLMFFLGGDGFIIFIPRMLQKSQALFEPPPKTLQRPLICLRRRLINCEASAGPTNPVLVIPFDIRNIERLVELGSVLFVFDVAFHAKEVSQPCAE